MPKCPYVDRECVKECRAYDETKDVKCLALHFPDRTNKLLNFIEKKISGK